MIAEAVGPVTKRTATGSLTAFPLLVLQMEKQTHKKEVVEGEIFWLILHLDLFFFGFGLAAKLTKRLFAEICLKLDGQLRSCQRCCCCLAKAGAAAGPWSCRLRGGLGAHTWGSLLVAQCLKCPSPSSTRCGAVSV